MSDWDGSLEEKNTLIHIFMRERDTHTDRQTDRQTERKILLLFYCLCNKLGFVLQDHVTQGKKRFVCFLFCFFLLVLNFCLVL